MNFRLPLLRVFTFEANHHFIAQAANFLEVHGHKLRTLCVTGVSEPQPGQSPHPLLDFCPNLKEMSIPSIHAVRTLRSLTEPHSNRCFLAFKYPLPQAFAASCEHIATCLSKPHR